MSVPTIKITGRVRHLMIAEARELVAYPRLPDEVGKTDDRVDAVVGLVDDLRALQANDPEVPIDVALRAARNTTEARRNDIEMHGTDTPTEELRRIADDVDALDEILRLASEVIL